MGSSISDLQSFIDQATSQSVVVLSRRVILDTQTPIAVLAKFKDLGPFVFLEGVSDNAVHDRYSYLGLDPYLMATGYSDRIEITYSDGRTQTDLPDVFQFLETFCQQIAAALPADLVPFSGGIMGYLTYECAAQIEQIPIPKIRQIGMPLSQWMVPKTLIIFDSVYHVVTVFRLVFTSEIHDDFSSVHAAELQVLNETVERIISFAPPILPLTEAVDITNQIDRLTSSVSTETYLNGVNECLEYIRAGDIFQIQLSRRLSIPYTEDPLWIYRYLRNYNPSPFMFYVKLGTEHLIGASPELLVNVEKRAVTIRPIAGTRRRVSATKTEAQLIESLRTNEKERAEHLMLVDLARNDIGRVCTLGSVTVSELMVIEKYAHVIHMVSNVTGELADGKTVVDALKYGFPAGTVTGAPKIRAMEIIAELEPMQREFYAGGVVFFDFSGNLKSAITIRSIVVSNGVGYTQAAGGIVADSVGEYELRETESKMKASIGALTYGQKQ